MGGLSSISRCPRASSTRWHPNVNCKELPMTRRPLVLLTGLALAAGCAGDPVDPNAITYQKDVRALVETNCLSCHSTGGIAPFTLTSFADVEQHKTAIKIAVQNRVMPP